MREKIKNLISKNYLILLYLLVFAGGLLRFYDLNWGAPFYFHPDERNIASSVSQLTLESLNPNFFAYGSLPIYSVFLTGLLFNFFTKCSYSLSGCIVTFEQAIIISRAFSALLGTFLIFFTYKLGESIKGKSTGLLAAFFTTFSVGLIQFSHFGTFEMWTATFAVLQLLTSISYYKNGSKKSFYSMVILTGILAAVKISNVVLILIPCISILYRAYTNDKKFQIKKILKVVALFFFLAVYSLAIYIATNPYVLLDKKSFLGSMDYESSVALGTMPVFYTGEFFNSVPIVFQLIKVFPFLLNPLILPLAVISLFLATYLCITRKKFEIFLLLSSFAILFFSQAFLFVKWTRYMLPTLPFIYVILAIFFVHLISKKQSIIARSFFTVLLIFTMAGSILFSLSYVKTVFSSKDTRILAKEYALNVVAPDSRILSEVYDLGITPFNDNYGRITLFNFYDLDSSSEEATSLLLEEKLRDSDYIIIPSQRILATRTSNPSKFPEASGFYNRLLTDPDSFTLIYETPCDIFCKITYLGDPIKRFEGTANVFDRPHILIFKVHEK